jgi:hypothetical protein
MPLGVQLKSKTSRGEGIVSDIQTKLGDGLSMLKGGIEQGKQKLQQVQEVSELRKKVKEASQKKTKILLDMGQQVSLLIREGTLRHEGLERLTDSLVQLDPIIYRSNLKIQEISEKSSDTISCECGAPIQSGDKFCGSCGKKTVVPNVELTEERISCPSCQEQFPITSKYCSCCGTRMEKES